jgi:hypothetical protein
MCYLYTQIQIKFSSELIVKIFLNDLGACVFVSRHQNASQNYNIGLQACIRS